MAVTQKVFGTLPCGSQAMLYTITNAAGASASITNYGGIVVKLMAPGRDGLRDVVLGCNSLNDYMPNHGYLGALVGRVGNRINRGRFTLNGVDYQLAANSNGHHLHGGTHGFNEKLWKAEIVSDNSVALSYESPDGEENYPGTLRVRVTYTFDGENALSIRYQAASDKDTLCNLTNHSYFNLNGEGAGDIADHEIMIDADRFTVGDPDLIPTGELRPVDGTPFDLRAFKRVGDGLALTGKDEQLTFGGGYDHNFALNGEGLRRVIVLRSAASGRQMEVYTDLPGVQFYTGNSLGNNMPGKCGHNYAPREGLCLETQFYPDSINHANFPDSVLRAGETYDHTTIYKFSAL